jgi:hypothetical protein
VVYLAISLAAWYPCRQNISQLIPANIKLYTFSY